MYRDVNKYQKCIVQCINLHDCTIHIFYFIRSIFTEKIQELLERRLKTWRKGIWKSWQTCLNAKQRISRFQGKMVVHCHGLSNLKQCRYTINVKLVAVIGISVNTKCDQFNLVCILCVYLCQCINLVQLQLMHCLTSCFVILLCVIMDEQIFL